MEILRGIAHYYETFHGVHIPDGILRQAVILSERYITDRYLPDKAIDLIDEACSDVNLHNANLAREAQLKKDLEAISKEREALVAEANSRDFKRQSDLKANESRQAEIRRELNKLTDEYSALSAAGGQEAGMKDNEREQARLQRELQKLVQDRSALNASTGDEDYQRLAVIKSRELQLQQELDKLEAQSAPPLTVAHLARVIELWTKIPASQIQEAEYERLAQLESRLKEHKIGRASCRERV